MLNNDYESVQHMFDYETKLVDLNLNMVTSMTQIERLCALMPLSQSTQE